MATITARIEQGARCREEVEAPVMVAKLDWFSFHLRVRQSHFQFKQRDKAVGTTLRRPGSELASTSLADALNLTPRARSASVRAVS
jgi:hypothetical protein